MTGPNATPVALRAPSQEAGASFRFRRTYSPCRRKKEASFSEEKEAKRLSSFDAEERHFPHQTKESFLVLFFKKEPLA